MEGLKEILESIKNGSDLDEGVDRVKELVNEEIKGLVNKRDQLLDKISKLKKGSENVDADKLEDEIMNLKDQLDKANRERSRAEKEYQRNLEQVTGKLKSESEFTTRLVVDNGLTDALIKAGVDEEHLPILREYHKARVKLTDEREALYVTKEGEKPLADYLKTWVETEGKRYAKAPAHSGGPIIGNKKSAFTGKDFSKMSLDEVTAYAKQGADQAAEVTEYLRNKKKGA